MFPITSLEPRYWTKVKHVITGNVIMNSYQIEGPGGLTLGHVTQDEVPNGEYDLPLEPKDFMEAYQ